MPTKHKRKRDEDKSHYDLPPNTKARSLPVISPSRDFLASRKKQKRDKGDVKQRHTKTAQDDTPKTFARLMAWHKGGRTIGGGLDDGAPKPQEKGNESRTPTLPQIQPGETLASYGVRVDQALPLTSLPKANVNPNTTMPADLIEKEKKSKHLTKHNKRLARMQSEWRNTEAKLRAKEAEEAEENAEKLEEERLLWDSVKTTGKKGKRKVVDDDPWKELEKKRRAEEGRRKGAGFALSARDQVQAPPEFHVKKLNPFKQKPDRVAQSA